MRLSGDHGDRPHDPIFLPCLPFLLSFQAFTEAKSRGRIHTSSKATKRPFNTTTGSTLTYRHCHSPFFGLCVLRLGPRKPEQEAQRALQGEQSQRSCYRSTTFVQRGGLCVWGPPSVAVPGNCSKPSLHGWKSQNRRSRAKQPNRTMAGCLCRGASIHNSHLSFDDIQWVRYPQLPASQPKKSCLRLGSLSRPPWWANGKRENFKERLMSDLRTSQFLRSVFEDLCVVCCCSSVRWQSRSTFRCHS